MTPRIAGLPWPNETTRYNKRIIAKVVIPITHQNLFTKNQWVYLNMVCIPSVMTTFGRDNMDHDDKPSLCSSEQLPTWPLNITAAVPQSWKAAVGPVCGKETWFHYAYDIATISTVIFVISILIVINSISNYYRRKFRSQTSDSMDR